MYRGCKTQGDTAGYKSSVVLVQFHAERTRACRSSLTRREFCPVTRVVKSAQAVVVRQGWEDFYDFLTLGRKIVTVIGVKEMEKFFLPSFLNVQPVRCHYGKSGWGGGAAVRSLISVGGMNNSMLAPLIYFTSVRERQGTGTGRKMEM